MILIFQTKISVFIHFHLILENLPGLFLLISMMIPGWFQSLLQLPLELLLSFLLLALISFSFLYHAFFQLQDNSYQQNLKFTISFLDPQGKLFPFFSFLVHVFFSCFMFYNSDKCVGNLMPSILPWRIHLLKE